MKFLFWLRIIYYYVIWGSCAPNTTITANAECGEETYNQFKWYFSISLKGSSNIIGNRIRSGLMEVILTVNIMFGPYFTIIIVSPL